MDVFREGADVVTVGTDVDPQQLKGWNPGGIADTLVPNDIESAQHGETMLRELLPAGGNQT